MEGVIPNFMSAGAVSINPIIGTLAILIVLAWRIAGYYGMDSVLLPVLGTPWTGSLARNKTAVANIKQEYLPAKQQVLYQISLKATFDRYPMRASVVGTPSRWEG